MRVLKKIVVFVIIIVGLLMATAFTLARIFEDELTQYVVEGLNNQLRTEIKVENINLSFLKKFPNASLEFENVFIASVPDYKRSDFGDMSTDTLLLAEKLFLRFNIFKLIRRQYFIREVQVRSGELNVFIDETGNGNYVFWERNKTDKEKNFLLALDNVKLSSIHLRFDNRALEINATGLVHRSSFKGQFSRESYSMTAGLDGMLQHYSNEGVVLLQEQNVSLNTSLSVDPQAINISEGKLKLAGQQMLVSGEILRPRPLDLDLRIEGRQLEIEQVLKHIVLLSEKYPADMKAGGKLNFNGKLTGIVSNTRMPLIKADFTMEKGWLQTSNLPMEIHDIGTRGSYSNGRQHSLNTTVISLHDMNMRYGKSRIGGNYSVSNLLSPTFNYKIKTDLYLTDLLGIKAIDSIFSSLGGRILAEISIEGNQAILENLQKEDLLGYTYNANIYLEEIALKSRLIPFELKKITGDILFTDHLELKSLSGEMEENQISISGRVDNLLEYLVTPKGNLWMDLDLYSERLDLNHLIVLNSKKRLDYKNETLAPADTFFLPERLFLKTRFWFDDLEIKDFSASNVTGNLIYKPRRLSINHVELSSMEGRIQSEGMLEQRQDMSFLVKARSGINGVNITEAFSSFNNFSQDFIIDQHLKGSLSGDVNFSAGMDTRVRINKESILLDCDVIIRDGELSGFEPMMSLSKYIDVKELENISFSTLHNEIFIRNEEVLIPKMDIHSSAMDITASGIHGFNKEFSYKVKLALSELLAKKSRKPSKQDSEFGVIEDDGLGRMYLYLIIEGSKEGTKVRYDRRGAIQNIREELNEEKQGLKEILNEEFGLFRKDSTLIINDNSDDVPDFIIEWEEDDSTDVEVQKPGNKSSKEKFIIEWDEAETETEDSLPLKRRKRRKKIN